jgi:8-oxo-dGTP diphosphatase
MLPGVGNRVRQLRQLRGISVSGLARIIAVSDRAVHHWESGRSEPRKSTARRLARALGVTVEELGLGDTGASMSTTRPVASCYIVEDRRLLMTKRRFPQGSFEWAAVSGQIEAGETPEQAAIREAREEVGLEIEVVRRLGERDHPATGRHLIYMAARVVSGTASVVDHEENDDFDWADLETVKARWANLKGGIFPPVLAFLEASMGAIAPGLDEFNQRVERELGVVRTGGHEAGPRPGGVSGSG